MMNEQHLYDKIAELQEEVEQLKRAKARFHLLPVADKQVYHRGLTILPFCGAAWVEVEFIERKNEFLYPAVVRMYYEDDKTKQELMVYERHCSKEDADAMLRLYG